MHAELYMFCTRTGTNPYDMLSQVKEHVDSRPSGSDKQQSIMAFNTVVALFNAARENPGLRKFAADLFTSLNHGASVDFDFPEKEANGGFQRCS